MDDLRFYWELFGWFWKLVLRPDFVLCFVIGAELIYQIRHDRRMSIRDEHRLAQERENIRKERGFKLLGLWYRQVGGGDCAHWLQPFEERHEEVKQNPKLRGIALFQDWEFVAEMVESFKQLRPSFAEYLDFEAANKIITHDWTSLHLGVDSRRLANWEWGVKKLEEVRQKDILPVSDCFICLTGSLLDTWKPGMYDATKLRAEYFGKKQLSRNKVEVGDGS
jgi:hypothetical protein